MFASSLGRAATRLAGKIGARTAWSTARPALSSMGPTAVLASASLGAMALLGQQSKVAQAQDAGIVSSASWADINADGTTEGKGQRAMKELGPPVHTQCCPTGTLEFMGKSCCDVNAVTATVQ